MVIFFWRPEKAIIKKRRNAFREELLMTICVGTIRVLSVITVRLYEADFSSPTAEVWLWTSLPLTACLLYILKSSITFLTSMIA